MLGNGICDIECATADCQYDQDDCKSLACQVGCYPDMVNDGVCNEACHVAECEWDGWDCDCSPGCTSAKLNNWVCDLECAVKACEFDHFFCVTITQGVCAPDCFSSMLGDDHCDPACNIAECEWDLFDCGCAPGCAFADLGTCKQECLVPECTYDTPDLLASFAFTCSDAVCTTDAVLGIITKCQIALPYCTQLPSSLLTMCCDHCCQAGYTTLPSQPSICIRTPDRSSMLKPEVLYMSSQSLCPQPDGSLRCPFVGFPRLVPRLWARYTVVYLLPGVHFIEPAGFLIQSKARRNVPRQLPDITPSLRHLTLRPVSSVRSSLSISTTAAPYFYIIPNMTLLLVDIDVTSSLSFNLCMSLYQCPTLDDLFYVPTNANLALANVSFANFQRATTSIIFIDGGLAELNHVNFTRILLRQGNFDISAVIRSSTVSSRLKYQHGTVSLLNNELDYVYTLQGFGFFQGDVGSFWVENVAFELNFVDIQNENDDKYNSGSLIFWGLCVKCVIKDSTFINNIGHNGALIRYKSKKWSATSSDYKTALQIVESGVYIENCLFRNNTGNRGSAVLIEYFSDLQRVSISNCSFENELALTYGIVSVRNVALQSNGYRAVSMQTSDQAGRRAVITFEPVLVVLTNLTFSKCTVLQHSLVYVQSVPNVCLGHIQLGSNRERVTRYTTTLAAFGTRGVHVPADIPDNSAPTCLSLINITSFTHVVIDQLTYQGICCEAGVVLQGKQATISNSHFADSSGNSTWGSVLALFEAINVTVATSLFENNTNTHPRGNGVVSISSTQLALLSSSFRNNKAAFGAGIFLNASRVGIETCQYEANFATFTAGGVLLQLLSSSFSILHIQSSRFVSNSAGKTGGALSLAALSSYCPMQVEIKDSVFEKNESPMGAVLYVNERVVLTGGLRIRNTDVRSNSAAIGGGIHLSQVEGLVMLQNSSFTNNAGMRGAVLYCICLTVCSVQLSNVVLTENQAETIVDLSASSVVTIEADMVRCEHNLGTCLDLKQANFTCTKCSFTANRATGGSAFHQMGGLVEFTSGSFRHNQALHSGGAGLLDHSATLVCSHCSFFNNSAKWQGGALAVQYSSKVLLTDTHFEGNYAKDSGFALLMFMCQLPSAVLSSQFIGNSGEGFGVIVLLTASLSLTDSSFENNESSSLTGGIMLHTSTISLQNCAFRHQVSYSGTFLYMVTSTANVKNSIFSEGKALVAGGGVYAVDSYLVMESSQLEYLESTVGAAIVLQKGTELIGSNCSFAHIRTTKPGRGVIDSVQSTVTLSSSRFRFYLESAIAAFQSAVSMFTVQFSNAIASKGGALSCQQGTHLSILNCFFEGLQAQVGGALYVSGGETGTWVIEGVQVRNNSAEDTGGIYIEDANVTIRNSLFEANSAYGQSGRGGAVTVITQSSASVVLTNCTFVRNSAVRKGGAISWEGYQPNLTSNIFLENEARYGTDVASYAVRLGLSEGVGLEGIPSGQLIGHVLELLSIDHYGAVVTIDSFSFAELSSDETNTSLAGTLRVQCVEGKFLFGNFSITAPPGHNTSLVVTSNLSPAYQVAAFSLAALALSVSMRNCFIGETLAQLECKVCQSGTYSLDPSMNCKNCPSSALCYGNFTMVPRPGYWRASPLSDHFFQCPNSQACLGSPDALNYTGECAEGYEGVKCQSCESGYYQWGNIYCSPCPTPSSALPPLLGGVLALTLLLMAVVVVELRGVEKMELDCVSVKIVVNYGQVVMLMRAFDLAWPGVMLELFSFQETIGAFPEFPFSGNCILGNSQKDAYYLKLLILACFQPGLVILSSAIWGCFSLCKRTTRFLSTEMIASGIILFFLAYPSVIRGVLGVYQCEEIEAEEWLVGRPIKCWDSEHTKYAFALALPSVIIWGLSVPLLTLLAMTKQRNRPERKYKVRYSFLTQGYNTNRYYWELCTCSLKFILIAASALLSRISASFQALVALVVLGCYAVLIHIVSPYCRTIFTKLETAGILAAIATLYSGLCYHTNVLGAGSQMVLCVTVICLNALYTGICLRTIARFFLHLLSSKFKEIFQISKAPLPAEHRVVDTRQHPSISEEEGFKFTSEPVVLIATN